MLGSAGMLSLEFHWRSTDKKEGQGRMPGLDHCSKLLGGCKPPDASKILSKYSLVSTGSSMLLSEVLSGGWERAEIGLGWLLSSGCCWRRRKEGRGVRDGAWQAAAVGLCRPA